MCQMSTVTLHQCRQARGQDVVKFFKKFKCFNLKWIIQMESKRVPSAPVKEDYAKVDKRHARNIHLSLD